MPEASSGGADACHLLFRDSTFDSTYGVTVRQHIGHTEAAVAEFARVPRPGGRVLVVEPELDAYAKEAMLARPSFVEIKNTMLFATVGQENGD